MPSTSIRRFLTLIVTVVGLATSLAAENQIKHVLLLSIDGMHALDLSNYVAANPPSALAQLSHHGVTFSNAFSSRPSDSFPGLLALITGGSTVSTGVWYDNSYDRALSPSKASGGNCPGTVGTNVLYDESIDRDDTKLDGGGGINPDALPRDPNHGCAPVYPHSFLRVNTIFEVIHNNGMRTAWSDKHLAYDLVNGPSGEGVDDLYNPEIAAPVWPDGSGTDSIRDAEMYDDTRYRRC